MKCYVGYVGGCATVHGARCDCAPGGEQKTSCDIVGCGCGRPVALLLPETTPPRRTWRRDRPGVQRVAEDGGPAHDGREWAGYARPLSEEAPVPAAVLRQRYQHTL